VVDLARARVAKRSAPRPTDEELARGIPLFVDQLVDALRIKSAEGRLEASAAVHGADLLRMGFTIAQVVHDYGDVCQVITQLAIDQAAHISAREFQRLNKCLDDAIAEAVTEYSRVREGSIADHETERLGFLAHELRNRINAATMAFGILKDGQVSVGGSTGAVLERNLHALQDLITRSLAEVRVQSGVQHSARLKVRHLLEEIEAEASMLADRKGVHFTVTQVPPDLYIDVDRALLAAALMNLLTNAFKFTPPQGNVWLRTTVTGDRVSFEVEDECGGLPAGDSDTLFETWTQRSTDKRGLGLGLPLVRRSVEAIGGEVKVTNMPGKGCVFDISVLQSPMPWSSTRATRPRAACPS